MKSSACKNKPGTFGGFFFFERFVAPLTAQALSLHGAVRVIHPRPCHKLVSRTGVPERKHNMFVFFLSARANEGDARSTGRQQWPVEKFRAQWRTS